MKIKAQKRDIKGKQVKNYRKTGMIPASVFGPKRGSMDILVENGEIRKLYAKVGYNMMFDLDVDGKSSKVLIKEIQRNRIKDQILHVGFYEIDEDKKLTVDVPVHFVGVSKAVKSNIGIMITTADSLKVVCLPKNIPSFFEIDISNLNSIGDAILMKDVVLPEGVEFESHIIMNNPIVRISTPQKATVAEETEVAEGEAEKTEEAAAPAAEK